MPYIRANGIRFACDSFGSMLRKPVFLIHGLASQRMSIYAIAERLADDYFVITYDCRGHGQTDHPASYTLADHGRDLLALIDAFGYDKAAVLGVSMGSYISLQAAEMASEKIEKLVLVATKGVDDGNGSSVQRLLREAGLDLSKASQEQIDRIVRNAFWSPGTTLEMMKALAPKMQAKGENLVALTPEESAAVNNALVGFDLRPDLKKVECPTLVIAGKYDGINPPAKGKEVADGIPGAEFAEIPGGHALVAECEDDFIRCVRAFLEKT